MSQKRRVKISTPYKRCKDSLHGKDFDAVIVGSGPGALSSGALLSQQGKRVLILEQHSTAGGFSHTFRRAAAGSGWEWDVGIHYIGDVHREGHPLARLSSVVSGGRLKWAHMPDVYDRLNFFDGRVHEFPKGAGNLRHRLKEDFPLERRAIDEYFNRVIEVNNAQWRFMLEKMAPRRFVGGPLTSRLVQATFGRSFYKHADKTTREVLEGDLGCSPELMGVLTGRWGTFGLTPSQSSFAMHALLARHYFKGGNYPVGGAASIAASIVPEIERSGGRIVTHARVSRILVEGGKTVGVELEDGKVIDANLVISDAGIANTYGRLLDRDVAERFELGELTSSLEPSWAHYCVYIGFEKTDDQLGHDGTNLWLYPGGYNHDLSIQRFREDPDNAPLTSAYVSFPSARDPEFSERFPGRATMEVVGTVFPEPYRKWADLSWKERQRGGGELGDEYRAHKAEFTDRVLDTLFTALPHLKGEIAFKELSTPLSTMHFSANPEGEIYGVGHTPSRFRARGLRPETPIPGLVLAGQDVYLTGYGGALMGGAMAASQVLGRNLVREIAEGKYRG